MPAVSTNFQVLPPSSISSSTGSRVVPATLVDDHPVLAGDLVQQRGLADVRAADQRDAARAADRVAEGLRGRLGQRVEDGVEQVAGAAAVQRGDRVRLAEAERPQRRGVGLAAGAVDLVGASTTGLPARRSSLTTASSVSVAPTVASTTKTTASAASMANSACAATRGVDAEHVLLPAAGVDELEAAAGPVGLVGDAVAGDARLVLDDGLAAADDPVDQGRLADVRAADDGQHGQRAVARGGERRRRPLRGRSPPPRRAP